MSLLPAEELFLRMEEWSVSVPLVGKMYDVDLVRDEEERWLRKTLRGDVLNRFYRNSKGLAKIFERHYEEHRTVMWHLGEFCIPTMFYVEEIDGQAFYRILQPWVKAALQYKEVLMTGRKIHRRQLPDFSERLAFLEQTTALVETIYSELPDLDFFVTEDRELAVFDTTGFWPERRDGKDRARLTYDLAHFLFSEGESERREVADLIDLLGGDFGR